MFVFTRWQQLSVLKYYIMAPSWTSMSMSMFLKSQFKGFLSEVPSKGLLSQAPLQFWSCGSRKFGSRFEQSTVYACISNPMIFNTMEKKERTRKKNDLTSGKAKATATAATITRWFLNQSQTASKQPVM